MGLQMGLGGGVGMWGEMSHFIPKTQDKSRHQRICLAAVSISRKMDNWTLLSAGFDVGEEADGGSRTTETPSERERGGWG